jgi:hypothetical protein
VATTVHPFPVSQPHPDPATAWLTVFTQILRFTPDQIRAFGPCPLVAALDAP